MGLHTEAKVEGRFRVMKLPLSSTMLLAFVALSGVWTARKLVPPEPFTSRLEKIPATEMGPRAPNDAKFFRPAGRKSPFGLASDLQVQTMLLNPSRLAYMARALRNTTCRDSRSACFSTPDSRFVDVGCGDGLATAELATSRGFNMVGVDMLEEAVAWASANAELLAGESEGEVPEGGDSGTEGGAAELSQQPGKLRFTQGSAYLLPFADRSVDGLLLLRMLEHIDDLPRLMHEVTRVLKPGGVLAFHTVNRTWLSFAVMIKLAQDVLFLTRHGVHDWRLFVKPSEITSLLRDWGFAVQRADFVGLRPGVDLHRFISNKKPGWGGLLGEYQFTRDLALEYVGYAILRHEPGTSTSN